MHALSRAHYLAASLMGTLCLSGAALAASTQAQAPCQLPGEAYCREWGPGKTPLFLRSYPFTVPGRGSALVTFNGSLYCANKAVSARQVVDFLTDISDTTAGAISVADPGALRVAANLEPAKVAGSSTSTTFNLASSRVFQFSASGAKTFYMRIATQKMDASTTCYIYNDALTVTFVP